MQSAACPRCAEPVRVPAGEVAATVRCPWCRETFELGEVFDALPPMLEIVDSDNIGHGPTEAPLILDDDAIGPPSSTTATFDPSALDDTSFHSPPRSSPRRTPRTSPVVSFLKIAGGGIAGIVIALAILQYWNRLPDLGFWPFRGPTAERVAGNSRVPDQSRAAQQRPDPANQRAPANQGVPAASADQDLSGETAVELALPDFGSDEKDSSLSQSIEQAERAFANYQAHSNGADNASEGVRPLAEALTRIGANLAEATGNAHEERQQIDVLVAAMATDQRLLKQLLRTAAERIEAADPKAASGIFAIGQLSANGSEYQLKKSTKDREPLRMLLDEQRRVDVPQEGAIVIVLGTVEESSGESGESGEKAIRARYVRSLVQRR